MKYRVVKISKNVEKYPDCKEDTEEFPHITKYVSDEMDIFIIEVETGEFYKAADFFYMVEIKKFNT